MSRHRLPGCGWHCQDAYDIPIKINGMAFTGDRDELRSEPPADDWSQPCAQCRPCTHAPACPLPACATL